MKLELRADQSALVQQCKEGADVMVEAMRGDLDNETAYLISLVRSIEGLFREIQRSKARTGR
jgi:hypothetical protein